MTDDPIKRAVENLLANDPTLQSALRSHHDAVVKAEAALARWVSRDMARQQDGQVMQSLLAQLREDKDGTRSGEVVPLLIDRYLKVLYQSLPEGHVLAFAIGRIGREAKVIRRLLYNEGML